MSITYYFSDALNYISNQIARATESDKASFICNLAVNEIWKKYDWRETLEELPTFYLVPGSQDHSAPAAVIPSDFLGLRQAYFIQLNTNPIYRAPITVLKDLALTPYTGLPGQIGYNPATASFRVFPRVPNNIGAPNYAINGEYKKRPPKVTSSTLSSTLLPFDDLYFFQFCDVLKWAAFSASGDQRAGGVQTNKSGMSVYTGQFAVAQDAIDQMAVAEGVELGDVAIAPSAPLAITSSNGWWNGGGPLGRLFG